MEIAVSSYSFSKQQGFNQLACIKWAKELGINAIEFANICPHDGSSNTEYAINLKSECEKNGIKISNLCFFADFLNNDFDSEILHLKEMVDIAEILEVPNIRHDTTVGGNKWHSFNEALPILAKGCKIITEYAETKNIKTMVENHGFFCQDSVRMEALFNAVSHPNFGLLVDIGNFLCVDDDPAKAVSLLAPMALYAHAKDFHVKAAGTPDPGEGFFKSRGGNYLRGAIIGHGDVPVFQCIEILKNAGYDGNITIEFEGLESPMKGIAIGLENLKRAINN
ncbi:MAG: sugar phosphate isomerase/epimerase family protein [Oscillospiraceae bacterium]